MWKKFLDLIKKSVESNNKVSSTRITSYIITILIISFCLYFIIMGFYIGMISSGSKIPGELLVVVA